MLLQSFGKTVTTFHARANVPDDVAHDFVGGLFGESLEGLPHGVTGVNHGCQLTSEDNEIGEIDLAASGAAFFADLFLDRDDQEVAVEQGVNSCLLSPGFDGTADFATGGRFPCNI